jgi:hypothetical protein
MAFLLLNCQADFKSTVFLIVYILITMIIVGSLFYYCSAVGNSANGLDNTLTSNSIKSSRYTTKTNHTNLTSMTSISVETDKIRYMLGESALISGTVNTNNSKPPVEKVIVQVSYLLNSTKVPKLPEYLSWLYNLIGEEPYSGSSQPTNKVAIVSESSMFTKNGSFSENVLNTENSGTYVVSATLPRLKESSLTRFEVENPFTTVSAKIEYIGLILAAVLILILSYVAVGFRAMEITNFLTLTVIVFTPILAFILADISLGPNSPVGLVVKHPTDAMGQIISNKIGKPEQGGQWVINVGGNQHNNYTDGIQIPVFVIVFGIIGGYLRFLYDRATVHEKKIKEQFDEIENRLYNNPNIYDKTYEFREISLAYKLKKTLILLWKRLNGKPVSAVKEQEPLDESEKQKLLYEVKRQSEIRQRRRVYLTDSLKDLAYLFLSPLLAIATWFLLNQAGLQEQHNSTQGQTSIFILAAVSFTVGLVTHEVVQYLINFVRQRLGIKAMTEES